MPARALSIAHWEIGAYASRVASELGPGESVVEDILERIQKKHVGIRGFSAQNIWRMKRIAKNSQHC
jgi:hypothetical protein